MIGITDFAQSSLGDVVFLELPEVSTHLHRGDSFGVIESIKSVNDLYAPLSGEILEVHLALEDSLETFKKDPYEAWIIKIKLSDPKEIHSMMNASEYRAYCKTI